MKASSATVGSAESSEGFATGVGRHRQSFLTYGSVNGGINGNISGNTNGNINSNNNCNINGSRN